MWGLLFFCWLHVCARGEFVDLQASSLEEAMHMCKSVCGRVGITCSLFWCRCVGRRSLAISTFGMVVQSGHSCAMVIRITSQLHDLGLQVVAFGR